MYETHQVTRCPVWKHRLASEWEKEPVQPIPRFGRMGGARGLILSWWRAESTLQGTQTVRSRRSEGASLVSPVPRDRPRRCDPWHPHPTVLAGVPQHRRGPSGGRTRWYCRRDCGDGGSQTCWPASVCWRGVLLESGGRLPDHDGALHGRFAFVSLSPRDLAGDRGER